MFRCLNDNNDTFDFRRLREFAPAHRVYVCAEQLVTSATKHLALIYYGHSKQYPQLEYLFKGQDLHTLLSPVCNNGSIVSLHLEGFMVHLVLLIRTLTGEDGFSALWKVDWAC